VFPFAIGAVVLGESCDFQTPLSGQDSPVLAVVPIGAFAILLLLYRSIDCLRTINLALTINRRTADSLLDNGGEMFFVDMSKPLRSLRL
jgi:hypothetical protein